MNKLFFCAAILMASFSLSTSAQCKYSSFVAGTSAGNTFSSYASAAGAEVLKAFDAGAGSENTYWGTGGNNPYEEIGVNANGTYDVCSIELTWGTTDFPVNFKVEGTKDYSNPWTELYNKTGNTDNKHTISIGTSKGSFNRFRMVMYGMASSGGFKLYNWVMKARSTGASPTVSITSPANGGAPIANGTDILITANASDADGIKRVEFYKGATKLGESATIPYSYTWQGASTGAYGLKAIAIDNNDNYTESALVSITVAPGSGGNGGTSYWVPTTSNINDIRNSNTGVVYIGPKSPVGISDGELRLSVDGSIYARKLTVINNWADYVLKPGYKLLPLGEVEKFIAQKQHLPDVPAEKEVAENGVSVGENQAILLRKIEELTLYIIEQNKKLLQQTKKLTQLEQQVKRMQKSK